ncbi:hypothetical protein D3Z50_00725 [Clostridiaceae bacterium]|jgi:hypothetical protein|nr:hypothetical protein [Clostridium sp.]NBI69608.1 hypothetical protein [Clostridiaceae bacterium]
MESRNICMQAIFSELSEKNKDIVILVAKSIKVAQESAQPPVKPSRRSGRQSPKLPGRLQEKEGCV